MNKKIFKGMSAAAIATIMASTLATPAFAAVDEILIQNKENKLSQYNLEELNKDQLDQMMGGEGKLYTRYINELKQGKIHSYHDDKVNAYVDAKKADQAYLDSIMDEKPIKIDDFTQKATAEEIVKPEGTIYQITQKDGEVVENPIEKPVEKVEVKEVSVINETTLEVTTEAEQTAVPAFEIKVGDKIVSAKTVEFKKDDTSKKVFTIVLNDADTLAKKQGEVLVNGKSAKYDNKLPAVASVEAVANNRVMVTFDEEVAVNTANIARDFEVKSVLGGEPAIRVESAVVQAEKTKVLLTLNSPMIAGKSNYVFNIKVDAVKDTYTDAANKNEAYQVIFDGVGAADAQGAILLSAQYEKATKKVTVVFNKEMKAALDTTKVSINGVALTAQDAAVRDAKQNTFVITLSDATKAKVDALTGDLTVKVAKDAVEDLNTEGLKNVETTATLKVVIAPEFVDADSSYDENTHILTLKFSAPVKVKTIGGIKVAGEHALVETAVEGDDNDEILDKDIASETVRIKLGATNQAHVQGLAKDAKLQVKLAVGAVEDVNKVVNSVAYDKQVKFVIDEVKPVLKTVAYSNADKSLTLEFSEPVRQANINAGNIAFVINGAEPVDSLGVATATKVDGNKLVLTLSSTNGSNDAGVLQTAYNNNDSIKVILKANAVEDYAGTAAGVGNNANDAMKNENAVDVVFANTKIPTVEENLLSNTQIRLTFTGKMDKALVENIANYSLKDIYGNAVAIKSVVQDSGNQLLAYVTTEKPMTIKTGDDKAYTLTMSNLKSVEGIIMPETKHNFDGIEIEADTTAPVINTAEYKTVAGYDNDTIKVVFTEASGLDKASAINAANYVLIDGTTETQLTADNAKFELAGTTVTITLKGINLDATKAADKPYKIKVLNVKDVLGNAISTKDNANVKVLAKAAGLDDTFNAEGITGLATANPGAADKMVLTFPEELDKATAEKVENYKIVIGGDKKPVTAVLDETGKKVTLTLADTDEIKGENVTVKLQTGLKDAAQNALATETSVIATVADLVKPAFAAQDAIKAEAKKGQDEITLKFTEAVQEDLANDETNYVVKVNGTALVAKADDDADYTARLAGDTVTITLKTGKDFVKGDVITVTAKGIKDIAGNTMDEATVTATATTTAAAIDTVASAVFQANSGNRIVEVTFADVLLASTVSKEDFEVEGNVVNDVAVAGNKVTLTLAAPVTGGQKVIVKASKAFAIKDEVGNELTVKSLGGETGVETTNAAEMLAAPGLAGVTVSDDDESNDKTSITMPALPDGATKFLYVVSADANAVATPKVGADWTTNLANKLIASQANKVTVENGKNIGIAAVDASNKVVQFVNKVAITEVEDTTVPTYSNATIDGTKKIVTLTFNENVVNQLTDVSALKAAIQIAADGSSYAALGTNDTVEIKGEKLVITFGNALTGTTNKIKVAENSLKDAAGNIVNTEVETEAISAN